MVRHKKNRDQSATLVKTIATVASSVICFILNYKTNQVRLSSYSSTTEEQKLETLVESLDREVLNGERKQGIDQRNENRSLGLTKYFDTCKFCKLEVGAEKAKLMTNSAYGIHKKLQVQEQKLCTVTCFEYLGAIFSDYISKPEVL